MKTTAIPVSQPAVAFTRSRFGDAPVPDFFALMKPRVMLLAVFTALVGLMIAPGHLDPLLGSVAILAIATGAGAAGVLNMWYDADIDAVMTRTARRPIPRGKVSRAEALAFGLVLAGGAVAVLAFALNVKAAALLAFTIFFYVVVYTVWLKRQHATEHRHRRRRRRASAGDWLGGGDRRDRARAARSVPDYLPVDAAAFLGAVAQSRPTNMPARASPCCRSLPDRAATTRQILIYSVLLLPVSLLPWALGFAGTIYGAVAAICGALFVVLAWQLRRSRAADRRAAHRLFAFSIVYLFMLFAALLADNSGNRWSSMLSACCSD